MYGTGVYHRRRLPLEILPPGIHQATLDEIEERFATNATFVEFLQLDRFTGGQKGIVSVLLPADPLLQRKADARLEGGSDKAGSGS